VAALLHEWLAGLAEEFARVDALAQLVGNETDPRKALELLEEWERALGFPDEDFAIADTLQRRRSFLHWRYTDAGGASPQKLVDDAAVFGFIVTIDEYLPFRADEGCADDQHLDALWTHAFQVNAPAETIIYFRADESAAGERIEDYGNAELEALITRQKPAHTVALFAYGG
jgi:uncharacterized protein YmfQ (DUF2313 family)